MTLTAHEQADVLMDLAYSKDSNSEFVDKKIEYLQMTNQLDFQAAYQNLFYLLWHTNLPCFETTQSNGERSLFKYVGIIWDLSIYKILIPLSSTHFKERLFQLTIILQNS